MGILDKIEDKLSGNKHNAENDKLSSTERKNMEKQATAHSQGTTGSGVSHGLTGSDAYGQSGYNNNSSSGTGNYGQTSSHVPGQALTSGTAGGISGSQIGSSSSGSRSHDIRHPVQSATGKGEAGQYSSSATGYGNDLSSSQSGAYKTQPIEAVDPYSTRGQNAMHGATTGASTGGTYGTATNDYAGRGAVDSDVNRSRHGGVTNTTTDSGSRQTGTGGGYNLENHDAIPTAGGEKLGGLGNSSGNDHHYGRDAAIGTGAVGTGAAYEEHKHRGQHESGFHLPGTGKHHHHDVSSSDQYNGRNRLGQDSKYNDKHSQGSQDPYQTSTSSGNRDHHYGRDAAIAGGAGALGAGAYEERKHHHDVPGSTEYGNTSQSGNTRPPHAHDPTTGTGATHLGSGNTSGPSSDHHYGRDATLGAGALGAGAAYEEKKHHHGGTSNDPYNNTSNTSTSNYGSGSGVGSGLSSDHKLGTSSSHHHHDDEERTIEVRLEELRLERRLKEIRAARGQN